MVTGESSTGCTTRIVTAAMVSALSLRSVSDRTMATHAMSNGSGFHFSRLQMTAIPEITRKVTSFLMPPSSSSCSSFSMRCFI